MGHLILSLFPGIDLLGRAFECEGYCVVRGPDLIFGGQIRDFHAPAGHFTGIIAGSPCQDFSRARRSAPTGYGMEMLWEFARVVAEARPDWWLLENVPTVPNVAIDDYTTQRFDLNARECGMKQSRLRHFQFGSRYGLVLIPDRLPICSSVTPICLATEGSRPNRRGWADFCEAQGLPRDFDLPGWSTTAKYRAVGNGVPIPMGMTVAAAIRDACLRSCDVRLCVCGCGRLLEGRQLAASPACRKRMERRRKGDAAIVTNPGSVTIAESHRDHAQPVTPRSVTGRDLSQDIAFLDRDLPGKSQLRTDTNLELETWNVKR
jgi:DNA (cytosine-5)-methyltransferase 1